MNSPENDCQKLAAIWNAKLTKWLSNLQADLLRKEHHQARKSIRTLRQLLDIVESELPPAQDWEVEDE